TSELPGERAYDPAITAVLAKMQGQPGTAWTLPGLARLAGMSRSSFASAFHQMVGEPPMHHLARLRVGAAARLFRNGASSVAEVARLVGYDSEVAFGRTFKRIQGQTPSSYRRQLGLAGRIRASS